jgi:valyl-tRNA synthetase
MDTYEFSESVTAIYKFFWNELCDWYLEWIKPRMRESGESKAQAQQVLAFCLDQSLRLLHPSMPYLTEQLWQYLNELYPSRMLDTPMMCDKPLVVSDWPTVVESRTDAAVEQEMELLQELIRSIRDVRTTVNRIRSANKDQSVNKIPFAIIRCNAQQKQIFEMARGSICELGYVADVKIETSVEIPPGSSVKVLTDRSGQAINLIVPLAELIDIEQEKKRIVKELAELEGHISRSEARLSNENFTSKAPAKVLEEHRQKLDELKAKRESLTVALAELK